MAVARVRVRRERSARYVGGRRRSPTPSSISTVPDRMSRRRRGTEPAPTPRGVGAARLGVDNPYVVDGVSSRWTTSMPLRTGRVAGATILREPEEPGHRPPHLFGRGSRRTSVDVRPAHVSSDLVRLLIVANELEAEMVRSLLSTAGIESMQRYTNFAAAAIDGMPSGAGRVRSSCTPGRSRRSARAHRVRRLAFLAWRAWRT